MSETKTIKKVAELWNLFERRVAKLCKEGRIPSVTKRGKSWIISANAQKTEDGRVKKCKSIKAKVFLLAPSPPLPIGSCFLFSFVLSLTS